jgi:hypothetical protein
MKKLFTIILLLFCVNTNAQIIEVKPERVSQEYLNFYYKKLDSLSKLYNKKVFGYQRSVTVGEIVRETCTIFYTLNKETKDSIVWIKELIVEKKPK